MAKKNFKPESRTVRRGHNVYIVAKRLNWRASERMVVNVGETRLLRRGAWIAYSPANSQPIYLAGCKIPQLATPTWLYPASRADFEIFETPAKLLVNRFLIAGMNNHIAGPALLLIFFFSSPFLYLPLVRFSASLRTFFFSKSRGWYRWPTCSRLINSGRERHEILLIPSRISPGVLYRKCNSRLLFFLFLFFFSFTRIQMKLISFNFNQISFIHFRRIISINFFIQLLFQCSFLSIQVNVYSSINLLFF